MKNFIAATCAAAGISWLSASAAALTASTLGASEPVTYPTGGERTGQDIAVVDVTGIPSWDAFGSPNNVVIYIWIGPFNWLNGIGFEAVLQSVVPNAARSNIAAFVTDSNGVFDDGFGFSPGGLDGPGGPTSYSSNGIHKLFPADLPDIRARQDGLIRVEFFQLVDAAPSQIDGLWLSGEIYLQTLFPIPAIPASSCVAVIGIFCAASTIRRSR